MYYHYQELGRSANTAHLYEAVCPTAKFEKVVFGDTEAETKLVQDILTETINEEPVTCVLYPSKDAILLSDWIKQRPASCKDKPIRYYNYPILIISLHIFVPPSLPAPHLPSSFFRSCFLRLLLLYLSPYLSPSLNFLVSIPPSLFLSLLTSIPPFSSFFSFTPSPNTLFRFSLLCFK
jgi:hypothetical protein